MGKELIFWERVKQQMQRSWDRSKFPVWEAERVNGPEAPAEISRPSHTVPPGWRGIGLYVRYRWNSLQYVSGDSKHSDFCFTTNHSGHPVGRWAGRLQMWHRTEIPITRSTACQQAERRVVQNILERGTDMTSTAEKTRSKGLSHYVDIHVTWMQEKTDNNVVSLYLT